MLRFLFFLSVCSVPGSSTKTRARSKSVQGALRLLHLFSHKNQKVIGGGLAEALTWNPNDFGPAPKKPVAIQSNRVRHHTNSTGLAFHSAITTPPDWRARQLATQWAWEAKVNETRREAAEAAQAAVAALAHQNVSTQQNQSASAAQDSGDSRLFKAKDSSTAVLEEKIHLLKQGTKLLQKKIDQKDSKVQSLRKTSEDLQHSLTEVNDDEGKLMARMKSADEPAQREMLSLEFSEMDLLQEATALQDRLSSLEKAAVANRSQAAGLGHNSSDPTTSDRRVALLEAKLKSLDAENAKLNADDTHDRKLRAEILRKSASVSSEDHKLMDARPSLQAQVVHDTHAQKQLAAIHEVENSLQNAAAKLERSQEHLGASQLSAHLKQMKKEIKDGSRRVSLLQGDQQVGRLQHTQRWAQLIRLQKAARILARERKKLLPAAQAESQEAAKAEHQALMERNKLRQAAAQLQRELRQAGALI
eukprot:gnl/MRDRNA2_/MRDRNA2_122907_c0_seq1.p1 gnl/MRDRNA2_/MRDRNA2_122907_c0~~gnl/MRDRNA2_/MRDRNA2_122907_c0_seq1.p1  ORF type:complete len:475 (-),score=120.15 gnl/MRDRNA2_/MRDRNA2_122907_c0_seq1:25-1449(-)